LSPRLTALAVFAAVSVAHFVVSVAGQILVLRVVFDAQPGGTARALDVVIVRAAELALAPLSLAHRLIPRVSGDYLEMGVASVAVAAAAVGAWSLARRGWRRRDHRR
jgi:hypothetical protein